MKIFFISVFLILNVSACQTVSNKIDEKVSEEEKQLSKWLNRSEEALKIEFGKPDKIDFKNNSRNRFYVYTKEKFEGWLDFMNFFNAAMVTFTSMRGGASVSDWVSQ